MVLLGDVLFIRQPDKTHRQIAGLLAALKKPARQTFIYDPPEHQVLRAKLSEKISVDFNNVPLATATETIAEKAAVDLRLDPQMLRETRIRARSPVTLNLSDQKLSVVLRALTSEWGLVPNIEYGVLWLTDESQASESMKAAVYDVRDLCRDNRESAALSNAILGQTMVAWGLGGTLTFAKAGMMVVRQSEAGHAEVLQLLENYRLALRSSKARPPKGPNPKEVLTYYYRLPTNVALDLQRRLPNFVKADNWQTDAQPDAVGRIEFVSSPSETVGEGANSKVVDYSVLVIRQTREVHEQISRFLPKILHGYTPTDASQMATGGMGGMGGTGMGGMGGAGAGFGSGFFSVP
jgi:hypothetical protein